MKLAIKGHPERGKEVIELLEMLGGINEHRCSGKMPDLKYYINIRSIETQFEYTNSLFILSLEQFEQMYPYKVGEKVLYHSGDNRWLEGVINKMCWDENNSSLYYHINNIYGTSAGQATTMFLRPMKQKELKDYLKPGYMVEYEDGDKYVITQDAHGNVFGIQLEKTNQWSPLKILDRIVAVYQINKPTNLHWVDVKSSAVTKVWERKEVELTMQQIADKFGIDVNQLKIKK